MADRIPVVLVTGFLGSGKTTLVNRFLATPAGAGAGVIVNEFGEVGVDHRLFVHAAERVELLARGRAQRTDIGRAFHELVRRAKSDADPVLRIVVETSGLADPAPIIGVLADDPWLKAHVMLARVVTVVDAVAGIGNIALFPEARSQVAVADTVVVTKSDLRKARPFDELVSAVQGIAADAEVVDAQQPDFEAATLFGGPRWSLRAPLATSPAAESDAASFVLEPPEPVDWPAFTVWLSALLHVHGRRILRVKGLLRTTTSAGPLAIHGVQTIMHPPTHLPPAACRDCSSFVVFITRGLSGTEIAASYGAFIRRFADEPRDGRGTGASSGARPVVCTGA